MLAFVGEPLPEAALALLDSGQAEIAVPPRDQDHVILEVFPLDFGLLQHHDIRF